MPKSIHPFTGEVLSDYAAMSDGEVASILERVAEAARDWGRVPVAERAGFATAAAGLLEDRVERLAPLITSEMGKPIREARAEVEKCALVCRYYAENGSAFLADHPLDAGDKRAFLAYEPLGVVLAVMPWNFPFWQVFRFAAPGLTAGNGAVLKHASNVTGCALEIESLLRDAGYPRDLFRTLVIDSKQVGAVIESPHVRAATLTGSDAAGRAVAERAGAALKKTVLELGGSDPYLILEDADLEKAVEKCVRGRMINGGQSCIAAKRFITVPAVHEAFVRGVVDHMAAIVSGDPMREETQLGPLPRADLREELHRQVEESVARGAELRLGGKIPDGDGAFYPPTVLTGVRPGMPAYEEELFGPVASILAASDEDDAIRMANDSRFGLGAAVFTEDLPRGERIARRLHSGCAFVNDFVQSDPRLPFGGIGDSGYGRELSDLGMREFVNTKTIVLNS